MKPRTAIRQPFGRAKRLGVRRDSAAFLRVLFDTRQSKYICILTRRLIRRKLRRLDDDRAALTVQFALAAAPGSSVEVRGQDVELNADGRGTSQLSIDPVAEVTSIPVAERSGGAITVSGVSVIDDRAFHDPVLDAVSSGQTAAFGCM